MSRSDDKLEKANLYIEKSVQLAYQADYKLAIDILTQASKWYQEEEYWEEYITTQNQIADYLAAYIRDFDKANEILLDKFESTGVNLNNVKFLERSNTKTEHLKCYNQIDISLDTFPYNGATTSFEAIWMGVPVLTLCGKTFHSRYGFSINKNLDMTNFIAKNKKDYVKKAIKLSLKSNYHKLTEIRKSLRQKAIKSPLFDNKLFSKNFIKKLSQIPN